MIAATLDPTEAAARVWDVIVIGAGPAGAATAHAASRLGAAVLLVDRATFPRDKVCGGCVSAAALALLADSGLDDAVRGAGARRIDALELTAGGCVARVAMPPGVAVSRRSLDAVLVRAGVAGGAAFLPGTVATVGTVEPTARSVTLARGTRRATARARVVVVADGLRGRATDETDGGAIPASRTARRSHMGLGALIDAPAGSCDGVVRIACGARGYVGRVRVEDGRLAVAAALAPDFVRDAGGPGRAIARLLDEAGADPLEVPVHAADEIAWRGTPLLTRERTQVAAARLLVIGDAAGYVEPFTGEGITWALAAARVVAPIAALAARRDAWDPAHERTWARARHDQLARLRSCRRTTRLLRHPTATRLVVRVLAAFPRLAAPAVRAACRGGHHAGSPVACDRS